MMSGDDEDLNLSLALGSANYRVQTKLSNSLGAGVNANFKVDMAFAASDPLSELVWSPHRGLSLKSANSSFSDKRPFLRWNVGASDEVPPPYQRAISMFMGEEVVTDNVMLTLSQPRVEADNKLGDRNSGEVEGGCIPSFTQIEECCKEKGNIEELAGTNLITCCSQNGDQHNAKAGNMEFGVAICSPRNTKMLPEDTNARPLMKCNDKGTSASGGIHQNMDTEVCFSHIPPTVNLEASDENELCIFTENEERSLSAMGLPRENSLPVATFPIISAICLYQGKGKEKTLSDGGIYRRSPNADDDSNDTVESCNSVGLFPRSTKRHNCDQDLITRNKRMKKQIQGSHGSTSNIKPHNSFMNWISNMVKGLSDSCKEDSSALGLTLACCNDEQRKEDQETFVCNRTHDSPSQGMGFQTMFQSLYCRDNKIPDTEAQEENCSIQESKEIVVAGKASLSYPAEPCHGDNEKSCKEIVVSNKQMNTHISINHIDQDRRQWVFPSDLACIPHGYETDLVENKATEIPACDSAAENTGPNFSLGMGDIPEKFNYLTSLWASRLSTRIPQLENCNQVSQQAIESIQYPKPILENRMNDVLPVDQKSLEFKSNSHKDHVYPSAKEMQKLANNLEASATYKLKPKAPSPEFGSSEAIASVFARRLDALKHIVPLEKNSTCSSTCFFCGKSGHDLRECAEVSETELENLLIKISSHDRMEESQCLCIRCFKFDHWAISCPSASSYRHEQSKQNVPDVNRFTAGHPQPRASKEPCLDSILGNLTWNANKSSSKRTNSDRIQKSFGSHSENEMIDGQTKNIPLLRFVTVQNIDLPVEIFHAIRKLRLSRGDILRCMNSHVSSAHLSGFFLRLRLGKLGLIRGETDYYVACITGNAWENIGSRSTKSILVDVGGFKSSVGSQYVSNHDFLEDEVKAWWSRILKTGNKIPSLDELNSKFKDRKSLGF